jgi:class 3 adenylate cyclase
MNGRPAWRKNRNSVTGGRGSCGSRLVQRGPHDLEFVLPAIRVPTLILHNSGDRTVPVESSRYMAERIPGAKYVEVPGVDHVPYAGNPDEILDEIEECLTGVRHGPEPDRVLATVLFTDIVDSTRRAAELGDRRWRDLLDAHHSVVRERLTRFRGREIDTAGDGFLATFDRPARGVRTARAIAADVRRLGLEVRAGLHTEEMEVRGAKLTGIAVHHISMLGSGADCRAEILSTARTTRVVDGARTTQAGGRAPL